MGRCRALLVRCAITDDRLASNEAWSWISQCLLDRSADIIPVEAIALADVPLRCRVARKDVLVARQFRRAIDGDLIIIPKDDEATKLEVAGKSNCLMVDAFHEVSIAGDHERSMVDKLVAKDRIEVPLGDRHSDGHCNALPERAGRDLDAGQLEILRMTGGRRTKLPEPLDVLKSGSLVAREIKQGIDQHRSMPRGENEAIAIRPAWIRSVEFQMSTKESRGCVGHPHGHTRVTTVRGLHRVHR